MNIGIIGTGAYGIALAIHAIKNNNKVTMWTKFDDEYNMLKESHKNIKALPNTIIPKEIMITMDLKKCIQNKDLIILAIPSNSYEEVCGSMQQYINENQIICIASKGITSNNQLLNAIVEKYLKNDIVILSGPSFAIDLIEDHPIGLTLASKNISCCKQIEEYLSNQNLCFDITSDTQGVQICGIIKNIFAIGSGILAGLNCLDSTKAAYLTKCIEEVKQIICSLGGQENTALLYCGIGDLILTCGSQKSRNFSYGKLIGENADTDDIEIFKNNNLIEGLTALNGIYSLINQKSSQILSLIYNIVYNKKEPNILLNFIHNKSKV